MLHELLSGFGRFVVYYVIAASVLLIIRALLNPPKIMEIFIQRKSGEIRSSLMIVFFMMAIL